MKALKMVDASCKQNIKCHGVHAANRFVLDHCNGCNSSFQIGFAMLSQLQYPLIEPPMPGNTGNMYVYTQLSIVKGEVFSVFNAASSRVPRTAQSCSEMIPHPFDVLLTVDSAWLPTECSNTKLYMKRYECM